MAGRAFKMLGRRGRAPRSRWPAPRSRPSGSPPGACAATTTPTPTTDLVPRFDEIRSLPSDDGGVDQRHQPGRGPADRALARRHALGADLGEADGVAARGRVPDDRVRPPRATARRRSARAATRSTRSPTTCARVVEGLDLHDAVLVGHSMGGIAAQLFCLRYPEVAAERVAGIVLLSTLSRTALSGNRHLLHALERVAAATPDAGGVLRLSRPRAAHRPDRLRPEPAAEPRRADPPDDPRVRPGDPEGARRARCSASTSPTSCAGSRCRRS